MIQRFALLLLLLGGLLVPRFAHAQLVVIDPAQVSQNVISLANDALNLLPLDVIVVVDTLITDIGLLNTIMQEGTQIGMDLASLQAQLNSLFNLQTAPATSSELAQRLVEIRTLIWQARAYAMRVNTLIQTLQNTLRHLTMLVNTIAELAGVKQGLQVLNQKAGTLTYVQVVQATQGAAFYQSELYDRQQQLLIEESNRLINQNMRRDYPTSVPGWGN